MPSTTSRVVSKDVGCYTGKVPSFTPFFKAGEFF
jgi:hypothetical protein